MMRTLIYPLICLLVSSCASINSVSLTPIPPTRNAPVRAQKSRVIFLGLNFDNDFVDGVVDELRRQCPNGKVTGLLTKDETINYFLFFVYKKQVTANGYCVPNAPMNSKPKTTRVSHLDSELLGQANGSSNEAI